MSLISISDVSLKFGLKPLLKSADLNIQQGDFMALVGRNGAGKTSLLKLIAGLIQPDSGLVERPKTLRAAYLPQDVPTNLNGTVYSLVASGLGELGESLCRYKTLLSKMESEHTEAEHAEFDSLVAKLDDARAWDTDSKIMSIMERLGIPPELDVSSASAGIKRRSLLGRELASEPDILVLDEPTNHLDIDSVLWLEKFLKSCGKTVIFVSHDRDFIRNLATRVVEVDRGRLISFDCGFDEFITRRDELLAAIERNEAVFDKKLEQEEAWLRRGIKARRTRNEGRVRELMKMREIRRERREKVGAVNIKVQEREGGGQKVLDVKNVSKSFADTKIIKDFSTTIFRGDKIGIIGRNGIGKTTLLNMLLGSLEPDSGEVLRGTSLKVSYFDQLRGKLNDNVRLFDFIGDGADFVEVNGAKQNVMGYLQNFLFSPEQILSDIGTLSGGEKNRLMLAKMFSIPANVLVLDEPTNDLDMSTIDVLENALMNFDGTVLLVSHDRSFLNNIVNCVFCFDDGGEIVELAGGYDEWASYKEKKSAAEIKKSLAKASDLPKEEPKKRTKLSNKEREELARIPIRIEEIEAERAEITANLEDSNFVVANFDKLELLNKKLTELNAEDDFLMERWEELDSKGT